MTLAWCTTCLLPGRISSARTYRVRSTEAGRTTFQNVSEPSAGRVNGCRRGQHEVRRAQAASPAERPARRAASDRSPSGEPARCQAASVAIWSSVSRRSPSPTKRAVPALGRPRRHVPARRHLHDLPRASLRVGERQQRERAGAARVMAGRAVAEQDRRDVAVRTWARQAAPDERGCSRKRSAARSGDRARPAAPCRSAEIRDHASHRLGLAQGEPSGLAQRSMASSRS